MENKVNYTEKSVKPKVDSLAVLVKQSPEKINQEEREDMNK